MDGNDRRDGGSVYSISGGYRDKGLSLRDFFAASALSGLLADRVLCYQHPDDQTDIATDCYGLADAMLAARVNHESTSEGE